MTCALQTCILRSDRCCIEKRHSFSSTMLFFYMIWSLILVRASFTAAWGIWIYDKDLTISVHKERLLNRSLPTPVRQVYRRTGRQMKASAVFCISEVYRLIYGRPAIPWSLSRDMGIGVLAAAPILGGLAFSVKRGFAPSVLGKGVKFNNYLTSTCVSSYYAMTL